MTDQTQFYVAFSHTPGIGPHFFKQLLQAFHSPQKAFEAKPHLLAHILPPVVCKSFLSLRSAHTPHSILNNVLKKGIQVLTPDMPEWPNKLRTIPDSPLCLYVKGNMQLLSEATLSTTPSLAIVGTRQATTYGRSITSIFAAQLAAAGVIIISGLAAGIDAYAHETTLNNGGKTIAVLGCGVDIVYPRQNKPLYERILAEGGAIISEFLPGQPAIKGLFVVRNRIVSGLSDGVLIIEGSKDSGTLSTLRHAGDQGRPVFGIPYSLNSPFCYAPNHAVQNGGTLAVRPEDIYSWVKSGTDPHASGRTPLFDLLPQEHTIFSSLQAETGTPDDLAQRLAISIPDILTLLTQLEMKGYVAKNTLGEYYIT